MFKEYDEQEKAEQKALFIANVSERFNDEDFITNVCLSYRHDYGLLSNNDRNILRFECKEWMRAILNNWDNKGTHIFPNVR